MTRDPQSRIQEVEALRRAMGTAPNAQPEFQTEFYRGVEGIEVHLVPRSFTPNPYRIMFEMATQTWGAAEEEGQKWGRVRPEHRALVVQAVLTGQALPLALEAVQFGFVVERLSRWAFDQLARARLGVVFASLGTRDNNHLDIGFRLHEAIWQDPGKLAAAMTACRAAKDAYKYIVEAGRGSWQEARAVLPISCVHRFAFSINYAALRNLCAQRMQFCEAEDVVAVAWLLRAAVARRFPYLAAFLRPGCDRARRCTYHNAYALSEAFGALFRPCGRWPAPEYTFGTDFQFNGSCSGPDTIARQLGLALPAGQSDRPEDLDPLADPLDRALFEED